MTLILLCCGMCIPLHGQNKITMTTEKLIGESIKLEIQTVPGASLEFEGLEEDPSGGYKVAARTFSIIGDVTLMRFTNCGIKEISLSLIHISASALETICIPLVGCPLPASLLAALR